MKKNHLFSYSKMCMMSLMGIGALFLASCASDGYDEESFQSDTHNTQMVTPDASNITVTASADGSSQTISWPLVKGAYGFEVELYNVNDAANPILLLDSLVEGYAIKAERAEDTNYKFVIHALGNTKNGNKDAENITVKSFTTFTPTYTTIPEGDLYKYFTENPIPADSMNNLNYDLVPDGVYTISSNIDFGGHHITLRTSSKTNPATLTPGDGKRFVTWGGLTLKYMNIDLANTNKALIELSETPDDSIKNLVGTSDYYFIEKPIVYANCNILNMGSCLIVDNSTVKYVIRNFNVNNCFVEIDKTSDNTNATAECPINLKNKSYITDMEVKNSTFYSVEKGSVAFLTYNGRPKDIDATGAEIQKIGFENSTLYQIAYGTNFRGDTRTQGQKTNYFTVKNCIIVDCGKKNFCQSLLRQASSNPTVEYANNTYWWDGEDVSSFQTGDGCDQTGTALTTDPGFADAANANFTVSGAQQLEKKTGDPRWLPSDE